MEGGPVDDDDRSEPGTVHHLTIPLASHSLQPSNRTGQSQHRDGLGTVSQPGPRSQQVDRYRSPKAERTMVASRWDPLPGWQWLKWSTPS